jgi:hypothetical protein
MGGNCNSGDWLQFLWHSSAAPASNFCDDHGYHRFYYQYIIFAIGIDESDLEPDEDLDETELEELNSHQVSEYHDTSQQTSNSSSQADKSQIHDASRQISDGNSQASGSGKSNSGGTHNTRHAPQAYPPVMPPLEKIEEEIAVGEEPDSTTTAHLDQVVKPSPPLSTMNSALGKHNFLRTLQVGEGIIKLLMAHSTKLYAIRLLIARPLPSSRLI